MLLEELRNKPEKTRKTIALSVSGAVFLSMFSIWFYANGYFGFSKPTTITADPESQTQLANVSSSLSSDKKEYSSPFQNTKNVFSGTIEQISKQYDLLKESLSSVFVPFITSIDVYQKDK